MSAEGRGSFVRLSGSLNASFPVMVTQHSACFQVLEIKETPACLYHIPSGCQRWGWLISTICCSVLCLLWKSFWTISTRPPLILKRVQAASGSAQSSSDLKLVTNNLSKAMEALGKRTLSKGRQGNAYPSTQPVMGCAPVPLSGIMFNSCAICVQAFPRCEESSQCLPEGTKCRVLLGSWSFHKFLIRCHLP